MKARGDEMVAEVARCQNQLASEAHFWFIWRRFLGDFGSIIFN